MDGPYIFDLESNSNGYDSGLDLYAPTSPKRKTFNGSNDSPVTKSSLVHDKQMDHIITQLHQPRPSSLKLITSFPSSSITSPSISASDSSSCLSITPSMIPEDCPCKCGSFRGSCLALTLPPSPLHFWVRGTEGEPAQHLFINDVQQFETVQRIELQNTLQEVHVRLDRLRETKSPPRSIRPWSEPKMPPTTLDVPNGSASSLKSSDCLSTLNTTSIIEVSPLSQCGGPQQRCKYQEKTTVEARNHSSPSNGLDDKIPMRSNPRHHYPLQPKSTKLRTKTTIPTNAPELPRVPTRASRTRMPPSPSKLKAKPRSPMTMNTATKTATLLERTTRQLRPPSSPTMMLCSKSSRRPRHGRSSSPKRQRGSYDDIEDGEEERQPKKR